MLRALEELRELSDHSLEEKVSNNDIRLGVTPREEIFLKEGTPVTLPSRRLNENLTITARIRGGKTWLMMGCLAQLPSKDAGFIVFERKKGSFIPLIDVTNALYLNFADLKHNLLKPPPHVPFRPFLVKLCSIFAGTQTLWSISEHDLFNTIWGVTEEYQKLHRGEWPDIYHIEPRFDEIINDQNWRNQRATNVVVGTKHRWGAMCTYMSDLYSDGEGVDICDLAETTNLIIDCSELPLDMLAFFVFECLTRLSLSRLFRGLKEHNSKVLITALDELEEIVSYVSIQGHSYLSDRWKFDRETNLGKFATSHAADFHEKFQNQAITSVITANSSYQVVGPVTNSEELRKIGRRLSFEPHHYEWLEGDVERRFVLASSDHPPICFIADEFNLPDTFDVSANEQRKKELLSRYTFKPVEPLRKQFGLAKVFRKSFKPGRTMEQVRTEAAEQTQLIAIKFMEYHVQDPFKPYEQLRPYFSGISTAHKAKNFCLEKNWVQEAAIPEGSRRPALYFHLTTEGRQVLRSEGLLKNQQNPHPVKHHTFVALCIHKVAQPLNQLGYTVLFDRGDGLDLLVKDSSGLILCGLEFNYQTPVPVELKLIQEALSSGVPFVIVVALDFKETKKNSFKMVEPTGKLLAFRRELETNFDRINHLVELKTWSEILKWKPQT